MEIGNKLKVWKGEKRSFKEKIKLFLNKLKARKGTEEEKEEEKNIFKILEKRWLETRSLKEKIKIYILASILAILNVTLGYISDIFVKGKRVPLSDLLWFIVVVEVFIAAAYIVKYFRLHKDNISTKKIIFNYSIRDLVLVVVFIIVFVMFLGTWLLLPFLDQKPLTPDIIVVAILATILFMLILYIRD